jgi:predicted AlkP superfamily phosphohydrolase/phosphomutase
MRVFLFGVDGLCFRIVDPLIERGLLPNFQRVRDGGARAVLRSTVPPMTPPAWMSIATGLPPAGHGVYDFFEYEQTEGGPRPRLLTQRKGGKAIWNVLSEWGKRVIVANVPMTYPPEPVNGVMLSGYMAPDIASDVTYPASFKEELLRAVPGYKIDLDPSVSAGQIGDVLAEVLQLTRGRNEMLRLLLERPWDFFFIAYTGADRIQHLRWNSILRFDPQAVAYYQMLDEGLGMVLDALAADDLLVIVSDHGFQGASRKFYLQEYLYRRGLLRMRDEGARRRLERSGMARSTARRLLRALRLRRLAHRARRRLAHQGVLAVEKRAHAPAALPDLDWRRTRAWVPSSSGSIAGYADIFLDEAMTEEQVSELVAVLRQIRDPHNGGALALQMYREDAFGSGPFAPHERHLVVLCSEPITLLNQLGRHSLWETEPAAMGIHHPDGLLYLYGAGVKRGIDIEAAHVCDVVPTILSYMGIPLPAGLTGRLLEEAFVRPLRAQEKERVRSDGIVVQKLKKLAL